MDFKEYIFSRPNNSRLGYLNGISQHGDPNQILNELFATTPCISSKKHEVRITDDFMIWYKKKTFWSDDQLFLYKLSDIEYCYISESLSLVSSDLGLVYKNGKENVIRFDLFSDMVKVFEELSRRITGFADTPATFGGGKSETILLTDWYDPRFSYRIINRQLVSIKERAFKEPYVSVIVDDIDKIMWCTQYYASDSDSADTYALKLYVLGKKKPEKLFCSSVKNAFEVALVIKDHIPHLLYGHNREYERLFKENPQKLMELAKSKAK